jgi:hypothetical protein
MLDRHISRRKAATITSIGRRSSENASFRTPVTLEAVGDPVTYSQKFHANSEVALIGTSRARSWRLLKKKVY